MDIVHIVVYTFIGSFDAVHYIPELKLLVDAVQASKFITVKKSKELIGKLEKLAGKSFCPVDFAIFPLCLPNRIP